MKTGHSHLLDSIFRIAEKQPQSVALVTEKGEEITYSALTHNILHAARYLREHGIRKGDHILLSAQKEVEFVYFYLAAHLTGAVNVVVDSKGNASNIPYIVEQTRPALALGLKYEGIRCMDFSDISLAAEAISTDAFPGVVSEEGPVDVGLTETATADIMFTSGTTGNPKGALLSHANLYASATNINSFIGNTADDVELLGLPICHSFGLGRLRCNLILGAKVILHNGFANLKSVFNTMEKYSVTGFGMVPAVWAYIKRFSGTRIGRFAQQLRYLEIGSASMPDEEKKLLSSLFPTTRLCMHYGLTEASRAVFTEFHTDKGHLDSIGQPVCAEVDVRIFDDDGNVVADGETGEICVKGNMVTKGYLNPADNIEVFHGEYFRTGDSGYRDRDGHLYLTARIKEIINVGGKKVNPVDIEDAVKRICGAESMAKAMADPDGILGEVVRLLVVGSTMDISVEDLNRGLRKVLPRHKWPRVIETVESIPLTSNGKKCRSTTT